LTTNAAKKISPGNQNAWRKGPTGPLSADFRAGQAKALHGRARRLVGGAINAGLGYSHPIAHGGISPTAPPLGHAKGPGFHPQKTTSFSDPPKAAQVKLSASRHRTSDYKTQTTGLAKRRASARMANSRAVSISCGQSSRFKVPWRAETTRRGPATDWLGCRRRTKFQISRTEQKLSDEFFFL